MFFRQLEYLTALARERHFGHAADACGVSQPALSAAIRKLEDELDVPIVRRGSRFEGFTPEGERVLRWAYRILADRDGLFDDLGVMRQGVTGTLRIGAIPTALTTLALLTVPFTRDNPGVGVSVSSMPSSEILAKLASFEVDAGVTYIDDEPLPGVRSFHLYDERYVFLTADPRFARSTSVGWAEVDGAPLCLLTPEMQNRRILDRIFAQVGVEPDVAIETDSISTLSSHVREGGWSSVVPHSWLRLFPVPEGMRALPLVQPDVVKAIGIVLVDRDPEPLLARTLVDMAVGIDLSRELEVPTPSDLPR